MLLEHQSTVDPLLAFRLFKYLIAIIDQHLKQTKNKVLPLVYPLVFYTGSAEYNGPRDIFHLFGRQSELARSIWLKPFHLIDAKQIPEDNLKEHFWAGIMQFVFKHRMLGDFIQAMEPFLIWLREIELAGGYDFGLDLLKYIAEFDETVYGEEFIRLAKIHLSDQLRTETMTLKEQFQQQGYQQALRETMTLKEQFQQQGYQQALRETMTLKEQFQQQGYQQALRETMTLKEQFQQQGYQQALRETMTLKGQFQQQGYQQGIEQGKQKGVMEAQAKIAKAMLANGLSTEMIADLTGLDPEILKTLMQNEVDQSS